MMQKKLIVLLFVFWGCLLSSPVAFAQSGQISTPPAYQFQSTSTCPSAVGQSSFATSRVYEPGCSAPMSPPRRKDAWNPWGEEGEGDPTDEGIGLVNTPIGSPLVLLMMAMIYLFVRFTLRKRSEAEE